MSELHPTMARIFERTQLDPSELALEINASPQSVTNWSKRGISKKGAMDVSERFGLSIDWIFNGEDSAKSSTIESLKQQIKALQNVNKALVNSKDVPHGTSIADIGDTDSKKDFPIISWVAAGSWTEVIPATINDVLDWDVRPVGLSKRAFGLIVEGRSMMPDFKPGEVIRVDPDIAPWELKDGDLVVVHCNDDKQATFKQLIIGETSDDMYLKPLNPDWPEQKMVPMGECQLVGVVHSKVTNFR